MILCFPVSAFILKTWVLLWSFCATFLASFFFPFLLVILLFQMAPKCSAEVLPSVPKCGKVVIVLMEKIPILAKLCSCRSYSAVVSLMLLI